MTVRCCCREVMLAMIGCLVWLVELAAFAQGPPVFNTVFPAGGQRGQTVEVTIAGGNLQGVRTLHSSVPDMKCERVDASRFRLTIPENALPGPCDLWALGDQGVSTPRTFVVSNRTEQAEVEPNDTASAAPVVPLDVVINGRIDKAGDADFFQFEGRRGQRAVIECSAERIDSRLRAVLEISDSTGRRLAINRGYFGADPLIDFRVPVDGTYHVKISDLISSGSVEHYYRLEIDSGPRVAFSMPNVLQRGKGGRVSLFGWNLPGASTRSDGDVGALDHIDVDIPPESAQDQWPLPARLLPAQTPLANAAFPFHLPGGHSSVLIGLTDVPVLVDRGENTSLVAALEVAVPSEFCGQLAEGEERDWFALQARRGEVLFVEALGQRIQSPVDLQISITDAAGGRPLAMFTDEIRNIGGTLPTAHLDPSGRWVCPADGRYLMCVRNMTGGKSRDVRRVYRLSVRREEPDFELLAVSNRSELEGLNVKAGGREAFELFAFRRRGMDDAIRVSARGLPPGVECPDVWFGPGVNRTAMVVSVDRNVAPTFSELKLVGEVGRITPELGSQEIERASVQSHAVRGGTIVRAGTPNGWGRITSSIPLTVHGDSPLRITADGNEVLEHHLYGKLRVKHSPGGIVDVAVYVERKDAAHQAPVKLTIVGLPESIQNLSATIEAGQQKGYVSFSLPSTLPLGTYSFVVRAETTVPKPDQKTEPAVVHSNPVVLDVQAPAFTVEVDQFAVTRAKRGETIRVSYKAQRINGFIGKMHTELAAPGRVTDIVGIRGRGETFTGQTDKGTLQIQINDDAPLGRQSFLRLFTVGVVEDEAMYFGSSLLPLEIVE